MLLKAQLRKKFLKLRNNLDPNAAIQESSTLPYVLKNTAAYQKAQHIALYLATQHEINLQSIVEHCWNDNKTTYLPCVSQDTLLFTNYNAHTSLTNNQFNILEPKEKKNIINPLTLDLVLMPLVAIDQYGNRLGMGKGYYDKTFQVLNKATHKKKPLLIGVCFECQVSLNTLPHNELDIRCNAILTHKQLYRCTV